MLSKSQRLVIAKSIVTPGLSNREVARRAGVDEKTVRNYRGKTSPHIDIQVTRGLGSQQYRQKRTR
jgi:transposase